MAAQGPQEGGRRGVVARAPEAPDEAARQLALVWGQLRLVRGPGKFSIHL